MLPDFPQTKRLLRKLSTRDFQDRVDAQLGPFSEIKRHAIHEGMQCRIEREDGSVDQVTMEEISSTVTYSAEEVQNPVGSELQRKLEAAADEMARKRAKLLLQRLDEEINAGGVVLDVGGARLSPDHILEMLKNMEVDFDDGARPYLPTLVLPPNLVKAAEEVMNELTNDPTYSARWDEIMKQKLEEFRAREANRRLAD